MTNNHLLDDYGNSSANSTTAIVLFSIMANGLRGKSSKPNNVSLLRILGHRCTCFAAPVLPISWKHQRIRRHHIWFILGIPWFTRKLGKIPFWHVGTLANTLKLHLVQLPPIFTWHICGVKLLVRAVDLTQKCRGWKERYGAPCAANIILISLQINFQNSSHLQLCRLWKCKGCNDQRKQHN